MAISSIQQVSFSQEWLVGDTVFFSSDVETDITPDDFQTEIVLPDSPPLIEKVKIDITAIGNPGEDGNVTYGGNFKPDMSRAEILGDLDFSQRSLIQSSFSVTLGAKNETDMFEFFVIPTATLGVEEFSIEIPYVEQETNFEPEIESYTFFNAYEGPLSPATENTVLVLNDEIEQYVQVQSGTIDINEQSFQIENVVDPSRTISSLQFVMSDSDPNEFSLSVIENLFADGQIIFNSTGNSLTPMAKFNAYFFGAHYNYEATFLASPPALAISNIRGETEGVTALNFSSSVFDGSLDAISSNFRLGLRIGRGIAVSTTRTASINGFIVDNDRNVTWNINRTTASRVVDNIFDVRSFHVRDITIRFESTANDSSTMFIEGFDDNSQFISKSKDISGLTVQEVVESIPEVANEHDEWVNKVFISTVLMIFYEAQAEWISNQSVTLPPGGDAQPFSFTTFLHDSDISFPLSVTIPQGTKTLDEIFDLRTLFLDFGYKLPIQRYWEDVTFINEDILELLDAELGCLILTPQNSGRVADDQFQTSEPFWVEVGGDAVSWDDSPIDKTYLFADYSNIGELVNAMNADFNSLNIAWHAGLFYESIDIDALTVNFDETFDVRPIALFFPNLDPEGFIYKAVERTSNLDNQFSFIDNTYNLGSGTVQELADQINADFPSTLNAIALNGNENEQDSLLDLPELSTSIDLVTNPFIVVNAQFTDDDIRTYDLNSYSTIDSLVSTLNSDWNVKDINFSKDSSIANRLDATPLDLTSTGSAITLEGSSDSFLVPFSGLLVEENPAGQISEIVKLDFTIGFADDGNTDSPTGVQVALGGYQIDGVDFLNSSPNTFFEPVFNTLFDIEFNTIEADKIYLLVRTREDENGTVFSANISDYSGIARFSNGSPIQILSPFRDISSSYVDAWGESDLGGQMPVAIAVEGKSTRADVVIDQTDILDSINVTIINKPESLDEFAFIAINRTNDNQSMDESRDGRVFGLVLDNRGAWDILVGPEAVLRTVADGEFDYAQRSYDRDFLDTDEGYDFEFFNIDSLPSEVQDSISLSPVPGYPQVWALRIEPGLKRYLASQVSNNATEDCSIDIDLFVTGRISGVEGICKITVFHDYRCVFDIGLCDFFWNLSDPVEPSPPEIIEDNLVFSYRNLIDCQRLDVDSDGSVNQFGLPIQITVDNVPTFENGNAILLIKTLYTPEIQGFYWPISSDFNFIQDGECNFINDNVALVQRINRPALYLPGQPNPIIDSFQISELIETEESYMYVQPRFQFPVQDVEKECGDGKFVLVGIGYQFKNWQNGFRADDVIVGANLVLGGDIFAAPEMDLCYRYYYNQDEG